MTALAPQILVIDDEQQQLETICRGLLLYGYGCKGVLGDEAVMSILNNRDDQQFDLVLMDLTRPNPAGIELIEKFQTEWPSVPIVLITGLVNSALSRMILKRNIAYIKKPFDPDTLHFTIAHSLRETRRGQGLQGQMRS